MLEAQCSSFNSFGDIKDQSQCVHSFPKILDGRDNTLNGRSTLYLYNLQRYLKETLVC